MSDRRLRVELLEDRRMLAIAMVDTHLDVVDLNDGKTSLREAIFATNTLVGPDTIEFDPTLAGKTILLQHGELEITDALTIQGLGQEMLTIDAGNGVDRLFATGDGHRLFSIDDGDTNNLIDVKFVGLTLMGGDSNRRTGGAIKSLENLTIVCSSVTRNAVVENVFHSEGGGIYIEYGNLLIVESSLRENIAKTTGGLALGGAVAAREAAIQLEESLISGNVVESPSGSYGGGVFSGRSTTVAVIDSVFSDNRTEGNGFGTGGGLSVGSGEVTIMNSSITGNFGDGAGGIYLLQGDLNLISTIVHSNTGSGIYLVESSASLLAATISGNTAFRGGGIRIFDFDMREIKLIDSTISGNIASHRGGGIDNQRGHLIIRNSTITQNTAPTGFGGGVVSNATAFSETRLSNSIVAGNTGDDIALSEVPSIPATNSFVSLGHNLIGTGNELSAFNQPGDQTGILDPRLGPLQNNGGPTLTHAPLPGSPAIDAGDPNAMAGVDDVPLTDQRGGLFTRVFGGRIDIGAVEVQPLHADFDGDGDVDGRDFLAWQRGVGTQNATHADGDADRDQDVDGDDLAAWQNEFGAKRGSQELSVESQQPEIVPNFTGFWLALSEPPSSQDDVVGEFVVEQLNLLEDAATDRVFAELEELTWEREEDSSSTDILHSEESSSFEETLDEALWNFLSRKHWGANPPAGTAYRLFRPTHKIGH